MNGQTLAILAITAVVTGFSVDAVAATATTDQVRICVTKVVFELNGVPRLDITATPGTLEADGTGLVNWTARDGRTGFCWIRQNGEVADFGFDNAEIIHSTSPVSEGITAANGAAFLVATDGGALNIRSSPGGEVINTVANGSTLILTGQTSGEWVEIEGGGWVSRYLLSNAGASEGDGAASANPAAIPEASSSETVTVSSGKAIVATGGAGLFVRSAPNGEVTASIADGTVVSLTGQSSGEWVEIEGGGWVSGAYLQYQ